MYMLQLIFLLFQLIFEIMSIWKSYMWTAEWRIIWRKIILVIYATYAVAKRKPEKKFFQAFFFAAAQVACITAMVFLQIIQLIFVFPFVSNLLAYIIIPKNYSFFVCFSIRSLYSFGDSPGVS